MFKLAQRRTASRGIYCVEEGLHLGGVPLIERDDRGDYRLRAEREIETILTAAYETPPDLAVVLSGCRKSWGICKRAASPSLRLPRCSFSSQICRKTVRASGSHRPAPKGKFQSVRAAR
jgi:hypothetical protein